MRGRNGHRDIAVGDALNQQRNDWNERRSGHCCGRCAESAEKWLKWAQAWLRL